MAMLHFILHRWIQAKQGCAASHPRLRPKYLRAAWTVRQQRQPRTPAAIKCPTLVGLGGGGGPPFQKPIGVLEGMEVRRSPSRALFRRRWAA